MHLDKVRSVPDMAGAVSTRAHLLRALFIRVTKLNAIKGKQPTNPLQPSSRGKRGTENRGNNRIG